MKSDPENIFISNGASEVARLLLQTIIADSKDGVMVPIPQYPLYSAAIALYGGELVPYYLDEDNGWSMDTAELQRSIDAARSKGIRVRALVFINPGNPTGQCLTEENIKDIITFCHDNHIALIADEVYQENVYNSRLPFVSARATLGRMPEPYQSSTELASLHTVSKGFTGECGLRGGYMELHNMDPRVIDVLYKISSINLCPNIPGQMAMGLMVNPPKPGDYSYAQFMKERTGVLDSLARRAKKIVEAFNALEGVDCQHTDGKSFHLQYLTQTVTLPVLTCCSGALYAFPRFTLPPAAIAAAKKLGKSPDVMYCLELLEETGLTCVPGSGFQQVPDTYHIRTTILVSTIVTKIVYA
jgi:glutamate--glyoxylate aminotransferase